MIDLTPRIVLGTRMTRTGAVPLASFPALRILYSSPSTYDSDLRIDRSIDGTGRGRAFYTQAKRNIAVTLPALEQDEVDQLLAFFNANMAEPFGFPVGCPPVEMSVVFVNAPAVASLGAGLYSASFNVTQFP
jgi:hypothetical protein